MNIEHRTQRIKSLAKLHGFDHVGIAKAGFMEPEARRLEQWLSQGYHGNMSYMENHFDKRVDPTKLVEGAKSVICLMYNYFPEKQQVTETHKIAKYAYGKDYHYVVKDKMRALLADMEDEFGAISGRCFVDSAPVLERDWAKRAGLGWVGKNTLLLNKSVGSFYFLAELIVDLELAYDEEVRDHCGTCTKCIDACPTDAISPEGFVMDGSKCISYLTIELKEAIPTEFAGKMEGWMFGCDICQDVCPWNRFSSQHNEPAFDPHPQLLDMTPSDWNEITADVFGTLFKQSAVKRTKFAGLRRNIQFLTED